MVPPFIPGLELAQRLHDEHLAPLLREFDPGLQYSAALLGYGSDVLGLDDSRSMDHNWGPRGQIFLDRPSTELIGDLESFLAHRLPLSVSGISTHFGPRRADGTQSLEIASSRPIRHLVQVCDAEAFFCRALGQSPNLLPTAVQWLRFSEQALLELTSGRVFFDGLGSLTTWRDRFSYYPEQVSILRMALLWEAFGAEEAFLGRAKERGDLLGLRLIAARQVSRLLKLLFQCHRRYIPYSKWFATKVKHLPGFFEIEALLDEALGGPPERVERAVADLSLAVLTRANDSGRTPIVAACIGPFHGRPYSVIDAGNVALRYRESVLDGELTSISTATWGYELLTDGRDFTHG